VRWPFKTSKAIAFGQRFLDTGEHCHNKIKGAELKANIEMRALFALQSEERKVIAASPKM
jgi:hypothetical protein